MRLNNEFSIIALVTSPNFHGGFAYRVISQLPAVADKNPEDAKAIALAVAVHGRTEDRYQLACSDIIGRWPELAKTVSTDDDIHVLNQLAWNEKTPVKVLESLAKYTAPFIRATVARNRATPVSLLEQLALDEDLSVQQNVAENAACPADIVEKWINQLRLLAKDKDTFVRADVAWDIHAPADVLEMLASDKTVSVREAVAENDNTPPKILEKLAIDKSTTVRAFVAENVNTPPSALELLARDPEQWVRETVLENTSTPPSAVEYIKKVEEVLSTLRTARDFNKRATRSPRTPKNKEPDPQTVAFHAQFRELGFEI